MLCGCLCAYCCAEAADASRQQPAYVAQPVVVQPVVVQGGYVQQYQPGYAPQAGYGQPQTAYVNGQQVQYVPQYVQGPNGDLVQAVDAHGQPLFMAQPVSSPAVARPVATPVNNANKSYV
ncbi:hypothetical protein LEN26_016681 [Aphanomyces euteiches]|nr:hypothetical protein LEN26_016681 [Aphanomyces euteiches]KAH9124501.1 hypothetical protein AeMF1_004754 [Aphanomyces euteiches]KAH9186933.1 hypothetical protein AeNC1_011087 [Aphanomyces euteiches]